MHALTYSEKELHSWPKGKRECTSQRFLINHYFGCSHDCFFCYANHMPYLYTEKFRKEGVITVFQDYDKVIAKQLDSIDIAVQGYLSPMSDPFQPINQRYKLSEKIIYEFVKRNIPITIVTKGKVSNEALELLATQKHSTLQVSILTPHEDLRKKMMNAVSTKTLFENIERASEKGIYCICRIDPILPFVTDNKKDLETLVMLAKESGASHIIASYMKIPVKASEECKKSMLNKLYELNPKPPIDYEKLYEEKEIAGGYIHIPAHIRKRTFFVLRNLCKKYGLSFSLCMEFENGVGMNKEFMLNCTSCEGINVPIYVRKSDEYYIDAYGKKRRKFVPLKKNCNFNCLKCSLKCELSLLQSLGLTLRHFQKLSSLLYQKTLYHT